MFMITEFLHQEVRPALGCTEPGAVALAVSKACEQLGGRADRLDVTTTPPSWPGGS